MVIFQPDRHLLLAFMKKHAKSLQGSVLDVGGGPRRYAALFKHCDYKTLDVEESYKPNIISSAEEIPLNDASLDGIICSQMLGDVWDVKKAITEIARTLKKGGKIIITESLLSEEHDVPHDYWRFTKYTWKKLLEEHFTIDVLEPRGGYHTQKAQNSIRYHINKYNLYKKPFLSRLFHLWALCTGHWAIMCDKGQSPNGFTLGYCIKATRI